MDIPIPSRRVQLQLLGIIFKTIDLTEVTREGINPLPRGQIKHRHPGLLWDKHQSPFTTRADLQIHCGSTVDNLWELGLHVEASGDVPPTESPILTQGYQLPAILGPCQALYWSLV